ncbi:DUF6755 family protein [Streptomyces sp. NPDC060232]|uniref:DUF6755 family protein n=1 Tax=Streptomyces sp. NPDC060232 TaxID=3347079 RepID=UPI00366213AF
MSVTQQPAPAPGNGPAGDEAAERLRDRISADSLTTRRDYLRIVATVSGGLAVGGVGVAAGILHRHGGSDSMPEARKVTDVLAPGESVAFRFPGDEDRALAVRLSDGTLVGIRHTGPGPGAGTEQEPERSSKLNARLVLALTVVVGQLWALTVTVNEWMEGNTGTAWWGAGFLTLSFLVVIGLWLLDPKDR